MAIIFWGTHVFHSFVGYYGNKVMCQHCGRVYAPSYVKYVSWFHLEFIPLIPYETTYFKSCPVCGYGVKLKGKEGREELKYSHEVKDQRLEPYVNHYIADKPKGLMKTDNSYEFHVKDLVTGEDITVSRNITKSDVNSIKKSRAYKKLPVIKIE